MISADAARICALKKWLENMMDVKGSHAKGKIEGDAHADMAEKLGMPIFSDLPDLQVSKERLKQIPYAFAKKHVVLPIKEDGKSVIIAVADPLNLTPIEELRFLLNCEIQAVYCPRDIILSAIHDCYNTEDGAASQMIANLTEKKDDGRGDEVEVFDLLDQGRHQS